MDKYIRVRNRLERFIIRHPWLTVAGIVAGLGLAIRVIENLGG